MLRDYFFIALGGALGSLSRFWLSEKVGGWLSGGIPICTFLVNASGSFAIGFLAAVFHQDLPLHHSLRVFLMIGFCGGYTTFSAFSLQTLQLTQRGDWSGAALNVVGSVVVCLVAVGLGLALGGVFKRG